MLLEPKKALEAAGAVTKVVSPKKGTIKGWIRYALTRVRYRGRWIHGPSQVDTSSRDGRH